MSMGMEVPFFLHQDAYFIFVPNELIKLTINTIGTFLSTSSQQYLLLGHVTWICPSMKWEQTSLKCGDHFPHFLFINYISLHFTCIK